MGVLPTVKIPERGPFRLAEIFLLLDYKLTEEEKKTVQDAPTASMHDSLGRWIRNTARLWTDGVDLAVEDVEKLKATYPIPYLEQFKPAGVVGVENDVDSSILHPDNISSVVIELYKQWLNGILTVEHMAVLD